MFPILDWRVRGWSASSIAVFRIFPCDLSAWVFLIFRVLYDLAVSNVVVVWTKSFPNVYSELLTFSLLLGRWNSEWPKSSTIAGAKTIWKAIHFGEFRFVGHILFKSNFRIFRFVLLYSLAETWNLAFYHLFTMVSGKTSERLLGIWLECWNLQIKFWSHRFEWALALIHSDLSFICAAFWWFLDKFTIHLQRLLKNDRWTNLFLSNIWWLVALLIVINQRMGH